LGVDGGGGDSKRLQPREKDVLQQLQHYSTRCMLLYDLTYMSFSRCIVDVLMQQQIMQKRHNL